MSFRLLDTVVLNKDLPKHGLKRGALGAIVEVHDADVVEVEFVTVSGTTEALLTLYAADIRALDDGDHEA